jgi:hypothetical protein
VYSNLRTAGALQDSPEAGEIERIARQTANRNVYLMGELLKIMAAFEARQIPAIPLKGPVLALSAYGDLSYRGFSDLDILIHEHDIAKAVATLAELGFRCNRHNAWLKPYLSFGHELDFIRDNGDVCVDLQWHFAKRWLSLPVNSSGVWNRALRAGRSQDTECRNCPPRMRSCSYARMVTAIAGVA